MRRRLLFFVSIAALVAGGVVLALWWMRPQPRIDQATLDKIQIGMSERDVIDLIGAPPGNYGVGEGDEQFEGNFNWRRGSYKKSWLGQEAGIAVHFDADGKVAHKHLMLVWCGYDSHFDKLLQLLHLRPKKTQVLIEEQEFDIS